MRYGFSEVQAQFIGPAGPGELTVADQVSAGLPLSALDDVVRAVSPEDASLRFAFVPRPTLARRQQQQQRLSPEESARVVRVGRVFDMAREAWGGDAEARAFLRRRHAMLQMRTPLEVALATDIGARLVEQILGRLMYGIVA